MTQKTVRLLMPQWQGGNNPNYSFGAELLAWLAPNNDNLLFMCPFKLMMVLPLRTRTG